MSDFRYYDRTDHRIKEMKNDLKSAKKPRLSDADLVATDSYSKIINESKQRGYSKYSYRFNTSRFMSHIDILKRRYHNKRYALIFDLLGLLTGISFGVVLISFEIYFWGIFTIIITLLTVYYLKWQDQEIRNRIPEKKN